MEKIIPIVSANGIIINDKDKILLTHRTAGDYIGYWGLFAIAIE